MPRRRPSQFLKDKLSAPRQSQGWFIRAIDWLFRSEASSALSFGVLFALSMTVSYVVPFKISNVREFAGWVFTLLIFGLFLSTIAITEDKNYRGNGLRTRIVCGGIGGAAIAVLLSVSAEGVLMGALVGAALGFFGEDWAKYL